MDKKPVFGTKEWADTTADICKGCPNDCHYCYAKAAAAKWARCEPEHWRKIELYWTKLKRVEKMKPCKVMFPAHHDILSGILPQCLEAIERLLLAGHDLLIVSKPQTHCIEEICSAFSGYKDRILFRFTIGSTDDKVLRLWEPNAPDFVERKRSLVHAYAKGFRTSVSAEPMLDEDQDALVRELGSYVNDAIWFGKPNFLIQRLAVNHAPVEIRKAGFELISGFTDSYIHSLYERYKDNPGIKWKESIKKIVGLEVATKAGTDL
jgi:DNA repair photolyase